MSNLSNISYNPKIKLKNFRIKAYAGLIIIDVKSVHHKTSNIKKEYLSNVYIHPLNFCGKKNASTFEPSNGGNGIKLKTQKITLNCIAESII